MSDKIKESLDHLQKEYNEIVAELGHISAQIAVKEDEIEELSVKRKDSASRAVNIINRVKSVQANAPKEEPKTEEKQNGES